MKRLKKKKECQKREKARGSASFITFMLPGEETSETGPKGGGEWRKIESGPI